MILFLNSLALALLITTVTIFRFRIKRKRWIGFYFISVFSMVWAIDGQFSQDQAIGIELAVVLLAIWVLFSIAFITIRRLEKK
jgi:drug/metabolite transporter (DMT)-like permease